MLNLDCELQVWYLSVHVNFGQFRSRGVCTCACLAAGSVCVCFSQSSLGLHSPTRDWDFFVLYSA